MRCAHCVPQPYNTSIKNYYIKAEEDPNQSEQRLHIFSFFLYALEIVADTSVVITAKEFFFL